MISDDASLTKTTTVNTHLQASKTDSCHLLRRVQTLDYLDRIQVKLVLARKLFLLQFNRAEISMNRLQEKKTKGQN